MSNYRKKSQTTKKKTTANSAQNKIYFFISWKAELNFMSDNVFLVSDIIFLLSCFIAAEYREYFELCQVNGRKKNYWLRFIKPFIPKYLYTFYIYILVFYMDFTRMLLDDRINIYFGSYILLMWLFFVIENMSAVYFPWHNYIIYCVFFVFVSMSGQRLCSIIYRNN